MFSLSIRSGIPINEQLYDRVAQLIISGELKSGEKLPTVRELAQQLTVNPNTIQKTYQKLEAQGFICSLPGKGSYVSGRESFIGEVKKADAKALCEALAVCRSHGFAKEEIEKIVDDAFDTAKNER